MLRKVKSPFYFEGDKDWEIQGVEMRYVRSFYSQVGFFVEDVCYATLVRPAELYDRLATLPVDPDKRIPYCCRKWVTDILIERWK
jgi:hypothetical protein